MGFIVWTVFIFTIGLLLGVMLGPGQYDQEQKMRLRARRKAAQRRQNLSPDTIALTERSWPLRSRYRE